MVCRLSSMLSLGIVILGFGFGGYEARAEAMHAALAKAALTEVIRPGYADFRHHDRTPQGQDRRALPDAIFRGLAGSESGIRLFNAMDGD